MFAGKQFDIVMGTDIHLIQPPGPVPPVPIPHPFIGIVFDPPEFIPSIGTILVNGLPRAQAGSNVKNTPPHIPIGGTFVKPPGNDGEVYMGAKSVKAETDPFTYFGAPVLTCQDAGMTSVSREERHSKSKPKSMLLPTSVLYPVPKGGPVMLESGSTGGFWEKLGEAALEIAKDNLPAIGRVLKAGAKEGVVGALKGGAAGAVRGGAVGAAGGAAVGGVGAVPGAIGGALTGGAVGGAVGGLKGAAVGMFKQAKKEIGLVVKSKKDRKEQFEENKKNGKEHQDKIKEELKKDLKPGETLLEQPGVRVSEGAGDLSNKLAKPDFAIVDANGNIKFFDAKYGNAGLSTNQKALQDFGGTLVGKNAGEFVGKAVPPAKIGIK